MKMIRILLVVFTVVACNSSAHASHPLCSVNAGSAVAGLVKNNIVKGDLYIVVCSFNANSYIKPIQGTATCKTGDILVHGGYSVDTPMKDVSITNAYPNFSVNNAGDLTGSFTATLANLSGAPTGAHRLNVHLYCKK